MYDLYNMLSLMKLNKKNIFRMQQMCSECFVYVLTQNLFSTMTMAIPHVAIFLIVSIYYAQDKSLVKKSWFVQRWYDLEILWGDLL